MAVGLFSQVKNNGPAIQVSREVNSFCQKNEVQIENTRNNHDHPDDFARRSPGL
jgi:hypothetical protein